MGALAKVLVIDDDQDFVASVRAVLEAEGYAVASASSGREGVALISAADPDVVICDVMMETTTEGYAVSGAVKMRAMTGGDAVPFIMVSSIQSSPDELFGRSEELGAIRPDAYLTKPLDIARFLEVVKKAVSRKVHA
jgi:DNA-binding response OmpR family regulator